MFEKPSLRTRVSFEAASLNSAAACSSRAARLAWARASHWRTSPARSQYVNAIVLRVFKHDTVEGVAEHSSVPVINGLSDTSHPCQAMADLLTMRECFGAEGGKTVAFVGDGNNVARSLAVLCGKLGVRFVLARPDGYGFPAEFAANYRKHVGPTLPAEFTDPVEAVKKADVIYTDVWTSMGQEAEREQRLKEFMPFQVNASLMKKR